MAWRVFCPCSRFACPCRRKSVAIRPRRHRHLDGSLCHVPGSGDAFHLPHHRLGVIPFPAVIADQSRYVLDHDEAASFAPIHRDDARLQDSVAKIARLRGCLFHLALNIPHRRSRCELRHGPPGTRLPSSVHRTPPEYVARTALPLGHPPHHSSLQKGRGYIAIAEVFVIHLTSSMIRKEEQPILGTLFNPPDNMTAATSDHKAPWEPSSALELCLSRKCEAPRRGREDT